MSSPPRGLTPSEAALWRQVAETVTPLKRREGKPVPPVPVADGVAEAPGEPTKQPLPENRPAPHAPPRRERSLTAHGLDGTWERKLAKAQIAPEVTIDLHDHGLDAAYARLMGGLAQALAMQARLVLVIAGRPRPTSDNALRGERRGAIRAKLLDWLAASPHASRIAAVRPAQPRHGGAGAVYVVLKRAR